MSIVKADSIITVNQLLAQMRYCRQWGLSFDACLAKARRKHQKEVREEAERQPLPQAK